MRIFLITDLEKIAAICNAIDDRAFDRNKQYRLSFIEELEREYLRDKKNISRIKLCIWETRLYDPTNRDLIVGKTYQQINEDAEVYRDIAARAKTLLDNAG